MCLLRDFFLSLGPDSLNILWSGRFCDCFWTVLGQESPQSIMC